MKPTQHLYTLAVSRTEGVNIRFMYDNGQTLIRQTLSDAAISGFLRQLYVHEEPMPFIITNTS